MEKILKINNLSVNFSTSRGTVYAVRDVSLSLEKGETHAIVGESGCGKTVTCRSIMRLLPRNAHITRGEIIYKGEDILKKSSRDMRKILGKEISMVFQDPMTSLDPTMKVGKQVREMILLHENVSKDEAKNRALDLLGLVGIENPEKRYKQYPHEFSGGQRQRIVIATALACNPRVLIADEPTTALDVTIQAEIIELLKDLQKKIGMSIIFITHDLGVVADIADRVSVMYAGKIVETGLSEEIFYDPRHPYTWGLLSSVPTLASSGTIEGIPGTPPSLTQEPVGDAFAERNRYALKIDSIAQPPMFKITDTHWAATWLLDPRSVDVKPPREIRQAGRKGGF